MTIPRMRSGYRVEVDGSDVKLVVACDGEDDAKSLAAQLLRALRDTGLTIVFDKPDTVQ